MATFPAWRACHISDQAFEGYTAFCKAQFLRALIYSVSLCFIHV